MPTAPKMTEKRCRQIVADRSEGFCERCCRGVLTTMHHRKKRGQGGLWDATNIVAVCGDGTRGCHGWAEHNPNDAADFGWHVRPWQDPAETPLLWRGSQWLLLTADGGVKHVDPQTVLQAPEG